MDTFELIKKILCYALNTEEGELEIVFLAKLAGIMLVILTGYVSLKLANKSPKIVKGEPQRDVLYLLRPQINTLIKCFFSFVVIMQLFSMVGVSISGYAGGFLAIIGLFSFAIHKGLSNLVSGLMLYHFKAFKEGDIIALKDGLKGRVKEFGLERTILITSEGDELSIPNDSISSGTVIKVNAAVRDKSRPSEKEFEH